MNSMSAGNHHLLHIARWVVRAWLVILSGVVPALAGDTTNAEIQYGSRAWQMDEGLPQTAVQALAQTRDGYLWIGTAKGLTRFDGARFTVFDSQNTPSLRSPAITALLEDRDGSLWIGTSAGLTQLKDGRFTYHALSMDPRARNVRTIFQSQNGTLWIGTLGGMYHWVNGVLTHYTDKQGLSDNVVRSVCESKDETWIGTASGLDRLRQGVMTKRSELGNLSLRAVLRDHAGNLWIGWVGGLMRISDGQITYFTKEDGLADNNVSTLYEDSRGELWVGTYSGLSRLTGGKFSIERDSQGAFFDQINAIIEDQEGDIWVGGRDGLQQLRVKRFNTYTRQQGLAHNNIMSVMEDHQGGIWISTWGGGLSRLAGGQVNNYNWENSQGDGLTTDLILSLCEDKDGSILIGTDYEGGAFRFSGGKFARIWSPEQAATNRVVHVIYRDREDNVWFGTSPGLVRSGSSQRWLEGSIIRCIMEDHEGVLWVGTNRGLFYRKDGKFVNWSAQKKRLEGGVIALYEDQEQNLWIGTASDGLGRYQHGQLATYSTSQGFFSDDIFEILEDDQGWLWMSSLKGVFRVSKKNLDDLDQHKTDTLATIVYGKSDGLESTQCNGVAKPAAWKGRDGRLWFATAKGLAVTDPRLNRDHNEKPPTVLIEEVFAGKKPLSFQPANLSPDRPRAAKLTVPAGHSDLEFHYTALSLTAPEKNRFKYKLEGINPDWVEGTQHVAYYNNLRPGKYVFRVMACNNDGVWNTKGAMVAMELLPHFWQTWWFVISTVFLLLAATGGGVRFVSRRNLQHQLQQLEQRHAIEQERIRIARDMHDEIGAKLTKISFLGAVAKRRLSLPEEAGQQIDKMSQTARDVIRALDEIVWAVNPANDSLEDLATYLCRNATEFFADSPIACQFNIPAELPACRLGMHVRHNILLAVKEALNNVLKHSGATRVHLQISHREQLFEVVVSDNGHGFKVENTPPTTRARVVAQSQRIGAGLTNMRQRMEAIGGHCRVESSPGQGTDISFSARLNCKI